MPVIPGPRDLLPISGLQHLLFCGRQCALIHIERVWAENRQTVEGRLLHRRVHEESDRAVGDTKVARGLELISKRLGLQGVADMVEFRKGGMPFPIEYKRGRPKIHRADEVQLCAQALCLEEMLRTAVPEGAIFYGRTRRRSQVAFDDGLRALTERTADRLHQMIESGMTPLARRERKCDRCSLLDLCLPDALRPRATASRYLTETVADLLAQEPQI